MSTEELLRALNKISSSMGTVDITDRANRLLGIVYGSQDQQLQQRATTYDLLVQLRTAGTEYDARQIRALTSSDVVSAAQSGSWTVAVSSLPSISGSVDVTDRAGRLLGLVYGSQGQQLLQRASTYDLQVQLRTAGTEYDARQIRALTSSDVVSAAQSGAWSVGRTWNLGSSDVPDLMDRAGRLLGLVYGSQGQQLLQRASTYDLQVQLRTAGTEYDARQIRTLTSSDTVSVANFANPLPVLVQYPSGTTIDPRSIRALISSDVVTAYGNLQALLQRASTYDLQVQLRASGTEYDARQIRALTSSDVVSAAQSGSWTVAVSSLPSISGSVDVTDRAGRLLGVVYGSQGQQLLQRGTSYDLLVTIRQAGSELSTSNPIFTGIVDASGNRLPSMDVVSRKGFVSITDGTNTMPTMDAAARAGFHKITDGTNVMTLQAIASGVYGLGVGVFDASGNRMPAMASSSTPGYVDVIDRAGRLVGVVYGSQGQQLAQRSSTPYELLVAQATRANLTVMNERSDLTVWGASVTISTGGTPVQVGSMTAGGTTKIKVYDFSIVHAVLNSLVYLYYGTSTTPTTRIFGYGMSANITGAAFTLHKSLPNPKPSNNSDAIYLYASVAGTYYVELGYVIE